MTRKLILYALLVPLFFISLTELVWGDITGSFVQLDSQLASFSESQWSEELGYMKAIGIDTVIIQYSVYGNRYYYPSQNAKKISGLGLDESINQLVWRGTARARYVKIIIYPTSIEWTMIAEVTVLKGGIPISLGKKYHVSPPPDAKYPDPTGKKLTDGSANWSWHDMVGWRKPTVPIVITIDLSQNMSFDEVVVKFMKSEISNVQLPTGGFTVQVSTDGKAFMPAGKASWEKRSIKTSINAIGNILKAAENLKMHVFVGLGLNPDYWSGQFDAHKESTINQQILTELQKMYGSYSSLAGWYLPEEFDDRNFNTPQKKEAVITYLRNMSMYARFYTHKPIMVAPYFGINPNGAAYAKWWDDVLSNVKVDIIAMQDGVGCHRTTPTESASVFAALQPILKKHGVDFWADIEVFNQIHGWPVDTASWDATPATINRVETQLKLEAPYVQKVVIFEFSHYMSPRLGGKAVELYNGYQDFLKKEDK